MFNFDTFFTSKTIGIDLGTSNSLVYVPHKDIVLNEPSIVAMSSDDNSILAVGNARAGNGGKDSRINCSATPS